MANRVYNALGGTPDNPCPTTGGAEFCSISDVRSWREAAARLYDRAILPTWQALLDVSTSQPPEGGQLAQLHERVSAYAAAYNELEAPSFFAAKNRERVTSIIALMAEGDALLDDLQAAIATTGNTAPAFLLPAPPAEPVTKHAASRWLLPAGAVLGGLVVFGLTAAAAVSYYQRGRTGGEDARRGSRAA